VITFVSERRHASWLFLFKGNGVAHYIDLFMRSHLGKLCAPWSLSKSTHTYMGELSLELFIAV
jgi:hypothetical protein